MKKRDKIFNTPKQKTDHDIFYEEVQRKMLKYGEFKKQKNHKNRKIVRVGLEMTIFNDGLLKYELKINV